ncbi:hypothetical protein CapIbe_005940 [Capra ibex]
MRKKQQQQQRQEESRKLEVPSGPTAAEDTSRICIQALWLQLSQGSRAPPAGPLDHCADELASRPQPQPLSPRAQAAAWHLQWYRLTPSSAGTHPHRGHHTFAVHLAVTPQFLGTESLQVELMAGVAVRHTPVPGDDRREKPWTQQRARSQDTARLP